MRFVLIFVAASATPVLTTRPAVAQDSEARRVRVSFDAGIESISGTTTQRFSVQKNLEMAAVGASVDSKIAPTFEVAATIRLARRIGVGVAVSSTTAHPSAAVSASIPHPFFFNRLRAIDGTALATRSEIGVHADVVWIVSRRRVELALSGGPTVLRVSQRLVIDVRYADAYPYDTASFVSAETVRTDKAAIGYNAAADLTWRLRPSVGVGTMIRYASAKTTLSAAAGNTARIVAGGLRVGAGIRFRF